MIEYIKGELTELTPAMATVEAAGVGYGLSISLNTFSAIQGKKEVKLYVYESIREDAYVLFGFVSKLYHYVKILKVLLFIYYLGTKSWWELWLIAHHHTVP